MNKRPPMRSDDVDYWRSMVDILIGLLLVIVLVMSLLMLGALDKTDNDHEYTGVEATPTATASPTPTPTVTPSPSPTPAPTDEDPHGGGGGGGGSWATHTPTPVPTPTPTPAPTAEENRSAVRVLVCDAETGNALESDKISFSLFSALSERISLSVYYPEAKQFSRFYTTKSGSFYLPEKLEPGVYTLRNLSIPADYIQPEDVEFALEGRHHWDDPEVITVQAAPRKGIISLKVTDRDTGLPVPGGVYEVVSVNRVTTTDGTVRYEPGEVVEPLTCDGEGLAAASGLYLGAFLIRPAEPPFGYARPEPSDQISLTNQSAAQPSRSVSMRLQRTTVRVSVRDQATMKRLSGVPFTVKGPSGSRKAVTDADGEILLVDLEKNTDYTLLQSEAYGSYQPNTDSYTFHVDEDGLIDGSASHELSIYENLIRCSFSVTSTLVRRGIVDQNVALFDRDGTRIGEWYSGSEPIEVEGLQPGTYVFYVNGIEQPVEIRNTSQQQTFVIRLWQTEDTVAVVAAAAIVGCIAFAVFLLVRRKKR